MAAGADVDAELVRRARGGELGAFEHLYRRHCGRVYALCLRLTADAGSAEELTQEAFVRAWRRLGSFRAASSFGTWLHRLAANLSIDALRARQRWHQRFIGGELPEASSAPADPAAAVDLERAIATLPPRARAVFVLHDVEGYRHREIARMCGLSVGTSKAHLHRARRKLREVLDR